MVDDWRVFARMGLSLVNDLAAIGAVPQHQVERPAREWLAADDATRGARPRLALDPPGFELRLQQPHRAELDIAAEDRAHDVRRRLSRASVVRVVRPRWSVSSTG